MHSPGSKPAMLASLEERTAAIREDSRSGGANSTWWPWPARRRMAAFDRAVKGFVEELKRLRDHSSHAPLSGAEREAVAREVSEVIALIEAAIETRSRGTTDSPLVQAIYAIRRIYEEIYTPRDVHPSPNAKA